MMRDIVIYEILYYSTTKHKRLLKTKYSYTGISIKLKILEFE